MEARSKNNKINCMALADGSRIGARSELNHWSTTQVGKVDVSETGCIVSTSAFQGCGRRKGVHGENVLVNSLIMSKLNPED